MPTWGSASPAAVARCGNRTLGDYACPLLLLLAGALLPAVPAGAAPEPAPAEARSRPQDQDLRARLTEREDENRVEQPWTVPLFGHPLSASLQYELSFDALRQYREADPPEGETRILLEQEAEPELFYTRGPQLSLLAQLRLRMERDLLAETRRGVSDTYVERGEMWLYSEPFAGVPLSVEIGRLDFEDDRRWWWDEDLDALRVTVAAEPLELALALARETAPQRFDRDQIEPDQEAVLRLIAEVSWDWRDDHSIQLFALRHDDRSRTPQPEDLVRREREDESDAQMTWIGARASGAWATPSMGLLGYWLDLARLRGDETALAFEPESATHSRVEARVERDVHGHAFDLGLTWVAPLRLEPRLTLGYARGSGDRNPDDGRDEAFRQTGLNGNAPGFGGVQSFAGYGVLLEPDLSNLAIVTVAAGLSLLESSSIDLVYHGYRQRVPADALADARLQAELSGRDRGIGQGLDLVLAVEEWNRFECELTASAFRAGAAFGSRHGDWTYGGFVALRLAF